MTSYCALMPPNWGLVATLPKIHTFTGWNDSGTAVSTADDGNAEDPEGKLQWGWWELNRSVCPCPIADRLGEASERWGAGRRGGPRSSRGQLGAWHVIFSGSRLRVPMSCPAPSPERAGKRQKQGCKITQTSSAGHTAGKGAGACAWGRETPKEEIP